jgi:hypothetical protein
MMVEVGSLPCLDVLSTAATVIAEGEVMQLAAAKNMQTSEDEYLDVIRAKTAALFAAVPRRANVLLVGDPYQLPPVGHGAPLRDLIDAGVPCGMLTEIKSLREQSIGMLLAEINRQKSLPDVPTVIVAPAAGAAQGTVPVVAPPAPVFQ